MTPTAPTAETIATRTQELHEQHLLAVHRRTEKVFAVLFVGQWLFGITISLLFSPYGWAGKVQSTHVHVYAAVLLGGAISSLPLALIATRPGAPITRYVVACAQMLWSALLIHLSGGRIETHFHVFGSLAFIAFFRDWRVLVPATIVVATDHFVRGMLWPESVYGITNPEWWRFLEHAFWVVFEDSVLFMWCIGSAREIRAIAEQRAELEASSTREAQKSAELDAALTRLKASQDALVRTEKLAAVGQLAASVGHELRNPLSAVRNASTFISKRLSSDPKISGALDPKVPQFLKIIERELAACARIISDLLDFARERPPMLQPCPVRTLVDEALSLLPPSSGTVRVVNEVPEDLPVPDLDKGQFRQIVINLVQNAVEAVPTDRAGQVVVRAEGVGDSAWRLSVTDNGVGIPREVRDKIFEPLFTTKAKGTGLGLAIVSGMVRGHGGTIRVESEPERGASFVIEMPVQHAGKGQTNSSEVARATAVGG